jgi:iron(II)-dependent oxidoreductase
VHVEIERARAITDALFALLRREAYYERPIPERHRAIFYLGHLEAFDWNLISGELGLPAFHPEFDRLFAFGIDPPMGEARQDQPRDWPPIDEVEEYGDRVRQRLDAALPNASAQILNVALEHRLMHAETFAYLLHKLPYQDKKPPGAAPTPSGPAPEPRFVEIPEGVARLGLAAAAGFGWDNEFEAQDVRVPAFSIGKHKVTNAEFLRFVQEGGTPPPFWRRAGGRWLYRGMFAEVPLPMDAPVYCSHQQAAEYAAWKNMRLPSEAEFHRAAWPNGDFARGSEPEADNFDFRHWDPLPVTSGRLNGWGLAQMVGNGWEWTASRFGPLPGFRPFPFYPGYSAPFFDGQHFVLKGASPRTSVRLVRPSFRNWFRGDYPYAYTSFRLVEGR